MKKILKMGVGALVSARLVVSVSALYQKRKDKNLRKLLALAKQQFLFDDLFTSWIVMDPILFHVHEGGLIRQDGTIITFEIAADTLRIVETHESEPELVTALEEK